MSPIAAFTASTTVMSMPGMVIRRFRAECLNTHWFLTFADAAQKMKSWRRYYNEERPHGAIGHRPPISLIDPDGVTSPPS